jgi:glycerophosphoryl diester phosphodiesterase
MTESWIIAHRGDSGNAPENTFAAFDRAWGLAVDGIEFDYHHSRDGIPIVIHDATLDRTTNACALGHRPGTRVDALSAEELAALDAAHRPDGRWDAFRPAPLPTVEAVLKRAAALKRRCVLERKAGDAETICRLIETVGAQPYVQLIAFETSGGWEFLRACRQRLPDIPTAYLMGNHLSQQTLDRLTGEFGATCINCDHRLLSQEWVEELRSRELNVWAWTVNDVDRARALQDWGVQALTTDFPEQMLLALRETKYS